MSTNPTRTAKINDRWSLELPHHRADWHEAHPDWEADRLDHMHARIQPDDLVMDVGAEEGDFTSLYRTWVDGDTGGVFPIECQPKYWPSIRTTWEANRWATPSWFVGFAADVVHLTPPRLNFDTGTGPRGWPTCSFDEIIPEVGFRVLAQQADSTPRARLDWLAAREARTPTMIVMDIEGAEYDALVGAEALLAGDRLRSLYVSVHPPILDYWYHRTADDVHGLMDRYGFTATLIGEPGHEMHYVYER